MPVKFSYWFQSHISGISISFYSYFKSSKTISGINIHSKELITKRKLMSKTLKGLKVKNEY